MMVMTLRRFKITGAFKEWEEAHGMSGPDTVDGEIAYQSLDGTNRPRDGFPCRVTISVR